MRYILSTIFLSVLLFKTTIAISQSACKSEIEKIPSFVSDSKRKFKEEFPVKAKLLPSITKSDAKIEIRFYNYRFSDQTGTVDVVRFDNEIAFSYKVLWKVFSKKFDTTGSSYKLIDYFSIKNPRYLYSKREATKLENSSSYCDFLKLLVNNHIFDLPSQKDISDEIIKAYNIQPGYYSNWSVLEIKRLNKYKKGSYSLSFDNSIASKDSNYLHLNNIYNAFLNLK